MRTAQGDSSHHQSGSKFCRCHTCHSTRHTMLTCEMAYSRHLHFQRLMHIHKLSRQGRELYFTSYDRKTVFLFLNSTQLDIGTAPKILFLASHCTLTLRHAALSSITSSRVFLDAPRTTRYLLLSFICCIRIRCDVSHVFNLEGSNPPPHCRESFDVIVTLPPVVGQTAILFICIFTYYFLFVHRSPLHIPEMKSPSSPRQQTGSKSEGTNTLTRFNCS